MIRDDTMTCHTMNQCDAKYIVMYLTTKNNEGRQAKNGGVKGRDGSAEELDRETGEEQITVGWTRRKDGG